MTTAKDDPMLSGLDFDDMMTPAASSGAIEPEVEVANEFMEKLTGQLSPAAQPAPEPEVVSASAEPEPLLIRASQVEPPPGAVLAANDEPFSDFDAAHHKAEQLSAQTGDTFFVGAISDAQYVVVPTVIVAAQTSRPDQPSNWPEHLSYIDIPMEELTLADFPDDHPIQHFGIKYYRKLMRKGFKLRESYRSMWPLMFLSIAGLITYLYPNVVLNTLPQDVLVTLLESVSPQNLSLGASYIGLGLGAAALIKVFIKRIYNRYMFCPAFVKQEAGIVTRASSKTIYTNIVNYEVIQPSIISRFFNFGTIELSSAASDGAEIFIKNIYAPRLVESIIERKMEEARRALKH